MVEQTTYQRNIARLELGLRRSLWSESWPTLDEIRWTVGSLLGDCPPSRIEPVDEWHGQPPAPFPSARTYLRSDPVSPQALDLLRLLNQPRPTGLFSPKLPEPLDYEEKRRRADDELRFAEEQYRSGRW